MKTSNLLTTLALSLLSLAFAQSAFAVEITTTAIPDLYVDEWPDLRFTADNAVGSLAWSIDTNSGQYDELPAGVGLIGSGKLEGAPLAGAEGDYTIQVVVEDRGVAPYETDSAVFSFSVHPSKAWLNITSPQAPDGIGPLYTSIPVDIQFQYVNNAGYSAIQWSTGINTSGPCPANFRVLPTGLSFDTAAATISGTPTTPGTYCFTIAISGLAPLDPDAPFASSLIYDYEIEVIERPPLAIDTNITLEATEEESFSHTFELLLPEVSATAPFTWVGVDLPEWLALSPDGILEGTPPSGSAFTGTPFIIEVVASDSSSPAQHDSTTFDLTVLPGANSPAPLRILTSALPDGTVDEEYQLGLQVTGGIAPYRMTDTGLPAGLYVFPTSDGQFRITGSVISSAAGQHYVTLRATDASEYEQVHEVLLSFVVHKPTTLPRLRILSSYFPTACEGVAYEGKELNAYGGVAPYTWSAEGLPAGLSIAGGGYIFGTPDFVAIGTHSVILSVKDSSEDIQEDQVTLALFVFPEVTQPESNGESLSSQEPVFLGSAAGSCTLVSPRFNPSHLFTALFLFGALAFCTRLARNCG